MKHILRFVSVVALAAVMVGCLETKVQILVKKDGSGTIIMQNLMSPAAMQMGGGMGGMMGGQGGANAPSPEEAKAKMKKDMMNEQTLKETAKDLGEGVTFSKVEFIEKKNGFFGPKATYTFEDITKVKMDNVGKKDGATGTMNMGMSFKFKKGDTPTLTIVTAKKEKKEAKPGPKPTAAQIEGQLNMMGGMMAGMKVNVSVRVDGEIVETNASYASKKSGKVTLIQMDMDEMMKDKKTFATAMAEDKDDPTVLIKHKVKGIKVEKPGTEINVQFK